MRKLFKDNSGVSLIIAIVFVSAFMLVIAGLSQAQLSTIHEIGNRETEGKVRYLAEGAVELASYWAKTNGVGANSAGADLSIFNTILIDAASEIGVTNCDDINPDPIVVQPCIGFEVSGRAEASDEIQILGAGTDYFSAPSKGTGNAGSCPTDSSDADQTCNWNTLNVGETVEIPLYYEMPDGSASPHDFSVAPHDFKLRVRAPCENFTDSGFNGNCDVIDRITLYPPEGSAAASPGYRRVEDAPGIPRDPVLMQWTISDFGGAGTSTLLARDNTVTETGVKRRVLSTGSGFGAVSYTDQNTEISAGRINLSKDVISLGSNDPLADFTVLQYIPFGSDYDKNRGIDLNKNPKEIGPYISDFSEPVLRLSVVGQPQKKVDGYPDISQDINDQSLNIPYLEYQVLTRDVEISDSKSFIRAWAEIGDFRKEIRKTLQREATLGGFAIEQF